MTDRIILGVCGVLCAAYVVLGGKLAPVDDAAVAPPPTVATPTTPARTVPTTTRPARPAGTPATPPGIAPTPAQMPPAKRVYAQGLLTSKNVPARARFRSDTVRRTPERLGMLVREFTGATIGRSRATRIESLVIPLDGVAHAKVVFRRQYGLEKLVRAQINTHYGAPEVTGIDRLVRRQISRRADVITVEVTYTADEQSIFAFARTNTTIVGVGLYGRAGTLHATDLMPLLATAVKNTGPANALQMMSIAQPGRSGASHLPRSRTRTAGTRFIVAAGS